MFKLPYMFKILNAGDSGVGKTTYLKRLITGYYIENSIMTIGTGFFTKTLYYDDSREYAQLAIWDFGGQERFHFFLSDFILKANAALLFFDLSRRETFLSLGEWVKLLRSKEKQTENLPILLIGGKCDLKDEISIEEDEISAAVKKYDLIGYLPTSSKDYINIDESMNELVDYIFKANPDLL